MPTRIMKKEAEDGFPLLELMAAVVISSFAAMAIVPAIQIRFRQAAVDSYTQKLEAGNSGTKPT